jgi:hypothetical protein
MGRMVQNPYDPKYLRSLLRRARRAVVRNGAIHTYQEGDLFSCEGCAGEYTCPFSDSLIKEIDKALDVD